MALLELHGVSKRFDGIQAVADVSFSVGRGEVVGFLGPNGAGKSTTMRLVTGFFEPDAGEVRFDGAPLAQVVRDAKRRIGYLPENNPLYEEMLVGEYLGFVAEVRGLRGAEGRRAIDEAVAATGLEPVFWRPVAELSKGFRQRTGLAQAIVHKPDLLLLDEPTEGLDPNQRVEIRRLIGALGRERTVLLSTHVLSEVRETCGRLLIIHRGRLTADGAMEDLVRRAEGAARVAVEASGEGVAEALSGVAGVIEVEPRGATAGRTAVTMIVERDRDVRPEIFGLAKARGWTLYELHEEAGSLEDLFRQLTADTGGAGA